MSVAWPPLAQAARLLPTPEAPWPPRRRDPRGATFTLDPWHDPDSVAFLCLHGPALSSRRAPAAAAGAQCQPIASTMGGSTFTARFDVDVLNPACAMRS